ncbi:uncharacterized protein EI90DRAFT_1476910 [Cantharellus anzutake]|uniref:uncharacterized protein n=1 Tax=Cantharellus anzutake TaxID=1750568 RepID=UPI0019061BFE|nr:uncharacterized protein EI90DRAFT_1476910 [Cantharellus anzutake]KAF8328786.1 hypothetical protein EI90DRAFT_1476910 [Cantharellus anzutake]
MCSMWQRRPLDVLGNDISREGTMLPEAILEATSVFCPLQLSGRFGFAESDIQIVPLSISPNICCSHFAQLIRRQVTASLSDNPARSKHLLRIYSLELPTLDLHISQRWLFLRSLMWFRCFASSESSAGLRLARLWRCIQLSLTRVSLSGSGTDFVC